MSTLTHGLRVLRASFGSNFRSIVRYYTLTGYLVSSLLTPVFLIATAWVVSTVVSPGGSSSPDYFREVSGFQDYLTFVIIGFAFTGLMVTSLEQGANTVYNEQIQGTYELIELTPASRFAWMFGKTIAVLTNSLLNLVAVLLIGALLFGLQMNAPNILTALAGIALTILALQGFAFTMAGVGIIWKQPHAIAVLLSPFFILISGMMFPVESLPEWLQFLSYSFPLTYGLDIVRSSLMLGTPARSLLPEFAGLILSMTIFMGIGYSVFRYFSRRGREVGYIGTY